MSEEEPAWRAELRKVLGEAAKRGISAWDAEVPGAEGALHDVVADSIMSALVPHIQAAEMRGRAAGAREIADHLESIDPIEFALGSVDATVEACRMAAEAERRAES